MASLKTRTIRDRGEMVAYFNRLAVAYAEAHGDPDRLLEYRLELIHRYCGGRSGVLLEIGCGTAIHLANLASTFSQLIGADISPVRQNEVCEEALNAALVKLESVEGGTCHAAGIDTLHELGNRAVRLEKFSPTSARSNRLAIENLYCLSAMRWCGSERERRHGHRRQLKFHAYLS